MANEFKVKKGLIVQGSGSTGDTTILDVQGNQGHLFSVTDSLSGSNVTVSGNISSSGTIVGSNLSGANTGDQDLSALALTANISGSFVAPSASFSTRVTLNDAKVSNIHQTSVTGNAGTATLASGLSGTPDIIVGSLTATSITSSIVTSSIIYTEGSNIFGDAISDTHLFNGHVTASGNISSSGNITLDSTLNFGATTANIKTTNPNGSGNINISPDGNLKLGSAGTDHVYIGRQSNTSYTTRIFGGNSTVNIQTGLNYVQLNVPVTASGNISASGTITSHNSILDGPTPSILLKDTTLDTTHHITSNNSELQIKGDQAIELFANNTSSIYIASDGDVGIGTDAPGHPFTVNGGSGQFITTDSHQRLFITSHAGHQSIIYFGDPASTTQGRVAYNNSSDSMYFNTNASTKLTILSSGEVGIGTTAPDEKLQVVGNISASGDLYAQGGQVFLGGATYGIEQVAGNYGIRNSSGNYGGNDGSSAYTTPQEFLHIPGTVRFGPKYATSDRDYIKIVPGGTTSTILTSNESFILDNDGSNSNTIIKAGNTELFITSSGNVGIGTNTPAQLLHVYGGAATIEIDSTTNESVLNFDNSVTTANIKLANGDLKAELGGSEVLRISSSGNVGIGTASPAEMLSVAGNISASGDLIIGQNATIWATNTVGGNVRLIDLDSSNNIEIGLGGGHNSFNYNNAFYVAAAGNVGIGTTSPGASLHVASVTTDYVAKFSHTTGTGYAPGSILLQAGQSNARGQGIFHYNTEADESWFTGVPYSTYSKKWIVANIGSETTFNPDVAQLSHALFTIDSDTGNVGIGTTAPPEKLTVTGNISASGDILANNLDIDGNIKLDNGATIYSEYTNRGRIDLYSSNVTDSLQVRLQGDGTKLDIKRNSGIDITGHVTASGNISASGDIHLQHLQLGHFNNDIFFGTDSSNNKLSYNEWKQSASGGTTINNTAGTINFDSKGNADTMVISGSSVGIGTTVPLTRLEVKESGTDVGITITNQTEGTGKTSGLYFKEAGSTADYRKAAVIFENDGTGHGVGDLHLAVNNAANSNAVSKADAKLTILHEGNVGIGTTAPGVKLDVDGQIRSDDSFLLQSGTTAIGSIRNQGGALDIRGDSTRDVSVGSVTSPQALFVEGTNGKVGIGTTSPSSNLHIYGNSTPTLTIEALDTSSPAMTANIVLKGYDGRGKGIFYKESGSLAAKQWYSGVPYGVSGNAYVIGYDNTGNNKPHYVTSASLYVKNDGNVGIGTAAPGEKLEVVGNISASGAIDGASLDINGAADISGNTQLGGTLTVGVNDAGHDVMFRGATDGAYFQYDSSEDGVVIVAPTDEVALGIRVIGGAQPTVPQFQVGRGTSQYLGIKVDDRISSVIHRQDETSGIMQMNQEIWDNGDGIHKWNWVSSDGAGANDAIKMTLDKNGKLDVNGEVECNSLDVDGNADISGNITTATWAGAIIPEAKLENQSGTNTGDNAANTTYGNVTNESKATMFTSPTFTGVLSGGKVFPRGAYLGTDTTGFLIQTSITTNAYAMMHGTIKLEQFNSNSFQTIEFSATAHSNGTVGTKAGVANIAVTIKLFNYNGVWYVWVPTPSTYTTCTAYIGLANSYQGQAEPFNEVLAVTNAAVPSSGVSNTVDLVALVKATTAYVDAKTWNWNDITAGTAPTFNQNTTGTAAGLTGTPDIIVGSLTATSITSSIVTSSIIYTEGSNIFGDAEDDTHTFTGDITASGNIRASSLTIGTGTVYDNNLNLTNDGKIRIGNAEYIDKDGNDLNLFQGKLKLHHNGGGATFAGHITASGNISASGTITQGNGVVAGTGRIYFNAFGGLNPFIGTQYDNLTIQNAGLNVKSHITASGNISASGAVLTNKIYNGGSLHILPSPAIAFATSNYALQVVGGIQTTTGTSFGGSPLHQHYFNGQITASSHISASGDISANAVRANAGGLIGNLQTADQTNITSVGTLTNINTSGHITASGNISASGNLLVGDELKINGVTALQRAGGLLMMGGVTEQSYIDARHDGLGINGSISTVTNITASGNISSSNIIQANSIYMDQLLFSRSGPNAAMRRTIYHTPGNLYLGDQIANVTVPRLTATSITSPGDISSSTTITANLIQTPRINGTGGSLYIANSMNVAGGNHITASGNISSSGNIYADRLISNGNQVAYNDSGVTYLGTATQANHFSTHITASGNISSSGTIYSKTPKYFTVGGWLKSTNAANYYGPHKQGPNNDVWNKSYGTDPAGGMSRLFYNSGIIVPEDIVVTGFKATLIPNGAVNSVAYTASLYVGQECLNNQINNPVLELLQSENVVGPANAGNSNYQGTGVENYDSQEYHVSASSMIYPRFKWGDTNELFVNLMVQYYSVKR